TTTSDGASGRRPRKLASPHGPLKTSYDREITERKRAAGARSSTRRAFESISTAFPLQNSLRPESVRPVPPARRRRSLNAMLSDGEEPGPAAAGRRLKDDRLGSAIGPANRATAEIPQVRRTDPHGGIALIAVDHVTVPDNRLRMLRP